MTDCIKCGKHAHQYDFHVLEVQTLHVRDMDGEKRVQALGEFHDFTVCQGCAQTHLDEICSPRKQLLRGCVPFGLVLVLGVVLSIAFWSGDGALRLMGLAAMICGVLGLQGTISTANKRKSAFLLLSQAQGLERAAWECMLASAPKKNGDNDITYVPVDKKTKAMKNGDLMVEYQLLPQIALQAYDLIRQNKH